MDLTTKVFGKDLKSITVNKDSKTVTAVVMNEALLEAAKHPLASLVLDTERMVKDAKKVSIVKCSENDEFDPYVGAALAIVYALFGSRTQFRKFVDANANVVAKNKEAK